MIAQLILQVGSIFLLAQTPVNAPTGTDWVQLILQTPVLAMLWWFMQRQSKSDEEQKEFRSEYIKSMNRLTKLVGELVLLHEMTPKKVQEDVRKTFDEIGGNL